MRGIVCCYIVHPTSATPRLCAFLLSSGTKKVVFRRYPLYTTVHHNDREPHTYSTNATKTSQPRNMATAHHSGRRCEGARGPGGPVIDSKAPAGPGRNDVLMDPEDDLMEKNQIRIDHTYTQTTTCMQNIRGKKGGERKERGISAKWGRQSGGLRHLHMAWHPMV